MECFWGLYIYQVGKDPYAYVLLRVHVSYRSVSFTMRWFRGLVHNLSLLGQGTWPTGGKVLQLMKDEGINSLTRKQVTSHLQVLYILAFYGWSFYRNIFWTESWFGLNHYVVGNFRWCCGLSWDKQGSLALYSFHIQGICKCQQIRAEYTIKYRVEQHRKIPSDFFVLFPKPDDLTYYLQV
jgi:hypothetical protein